MTVPVTGGEPTPRPEPIADDALLDAIDEDAGLKPGTRGARRWLVLAFRISLSGVMLWFLLTKISDSQGPALPEWNRSTALWLAGATLLTLAGIVLSAARWQAVLAAMGQHDALRVAAVALHGRPVRGQRAAHHDRRRRAPRQPPVPRLG